MLARAILPLLLVGCASAPAASCPKTSPVELATPARPVPEVESAKGLTEGQLAAQRIAKECARGKVGACQAIADHMARRKPAETDAELEKRGPDEEIALANDASRAEEEAALGEKLLEAAGPERLRAPHHLEIACDLSHAEACNNLGWAWSRGFGVMAKDEEKAAELYERACNLGSVLGCLNRGRLARPSNTAKAAQYMRRACEQQHEQACAELAGTVAEAELACKKSASQCNNWGLIQQRGDGVRVDIKKAFAQYERACAAKDPTGCFNSGVLLRDGQNGKVDRAGARRRFDAACKGKFDRGCREAALLGP